MLWLQPYHSNNPCIVNAIVVSPVYSGAQSTYLSISNNKFISLALAWNFYSHNIQFILILHRKSDIRHVHFPLKIYYIAVHIFYILLLL